MPGSLSDFDLTHLKIRADTIEAELRGRRNIVLVPSVTLEQGDGLPSFDHDSVRSFKSKEVPSFKREGVPTLENEGVPGLGVVADFEASKYRLPFTEIQGTLLSSRMLTLEPLDVGMILEATGSPQETPRAGSETRHRLQKL